MTTLIDSIYRRRRKEPSQKRLNRARRYVEIDKYRKRNPGDDKNRRDDDDMNRHDGVGNSEKPTKRRRHMGTQRRRSSLELLAPEKKPTRLPSRRKSAAEARERLRLMTSEEAAIRRATDGTVAANNIGLADNENDDFLPEGKQWQEVVEHNFDHASHWYCLPRKQRQRQR